MKLIPRSLCYLAAGLLAFYAACCLMFSITNPVVILMLVLAAGLVCYTFLFGKIPPKARRAIHILGASGLAAAAVLTGVMLYAAHAIPPDYENPPGTAVVLGAKISGDEPSLMLQRRLNVAYDYLQRVPTANVVVSGGQGRDEAVAESRVMKQYLVGRGIDPSRIYEENASENTGENLALSAQIIRANGLDERVVICTDGFHQLRSAYFAGRNGLEPAASLSSKTPWGLVPMYYIREWVGLAKALITGT